MTLDEAALLFFFSTRSKTVTLKQNGKFAKKLRNFASRLVVRKRLKSQGERVNHHQVGTVTEI